MANSNAFRQKMTVGMRKRQEPNVTDGKFDGNCGDRSTGPLPKCREALKDPRGMCKYVVILPVCTI